MARSARPAGTDMRAVIEQLIARHGAPTPGIDREAALADMRFSFLERPVRAHGGAPARKPRAQAQRWRVDKRSDRALHRPSRASSRIMALVFVLTFSAWLGALAVRWLSAPAWMRPLAAHRRRACERHGELNHRGASLVVDGVCAGVGSVLIGFLPTIVTLFFFLSILGGLGLHGARGVRHGPAAAPHGPVRAAAIVPMLMGFGCTVPAIMSTRTLPSERDRKMTIMLAPFMSCIGQAAGLRALSWRAFFPRDGAAARR